MIEKWPKYFQLLKDGAGLVDHGVPGGLSAASGACVQGGDAGVSACKVTLLKFSLVVSMLLVSMLHPSLLQLVVFHGSALNLNHPTGRSRVVWSRRC